MLLRFVIPVYFISHYRADANLSRAFNPLDPMSQFDPFGILNNTELSDQCKRDVTKFATSLNTYVTTFVACQQNGSCTAEQQRILDENAYAVQQIDAFGKVPPGLMELTLVSSGSYRECIELVAPYKVQYCFANAIFPNMDMKNFMNAIIAQQTVARGIEFTDTKCVPIKNEYSTAFWIFTSCMVFFITWAIFATIVDYILDEYYKNSIKGKALQAFLAFSFYTNASILMNVKPHKEGTIKSLASIRFISMSWVVVGHVLGTDAGCDRLKPALEMVNPLLSTTLTNAFFSVDTFFLLSGILVSYLFFKAKPTLGYIKNVYVWVMYYVHRYLRLTPPIMLFIGFYVTFDPFINGPWSISSIQFMPQDTAPCKKYWWRNLLYINNFFSQTDACYGITWYLAVDTQLYFVAPVFLVMLFFSPFAGIALIVACIIGSVVYVYAVTIQRSYPALMMAGTIDMDVFMEFFADYYAKPWSRCPPYLIGIAVGYFLALKKKPRLNKVMVLSLWIVATAMALASLYGPHQYIKGAADWSEFVRGSYNNFSRIGWALAVSWVIIANHLGWGGIVADFMDHPLWQPLGRLSYSGFIVHFWLIRYIFNLDDRSAHFVSIWRTYIHLGISTTVVSYVFAFFWSGLFELPILKLEKLLTESLVPSRNKQPVKPVFDATAKLKEEVRLEESETVRPGQSDGIVKQSTSNADGDHKTNSPGSVLTTKLQYVISGDDGKGQLAEAITKQEITEAEKFEEIVLKL